MDGLCLWPVVELSCWSSPRLGWRWRWRCWLLAGTAQGAVHLAEVILLPRLHSAANTALWHHPLCPLTDASVMHRRLQFENCNCVRPTEWYHACFARRRLGWFAMRRMGEAASNLHMPEKWPPSFAGGLPPSNGFKAMVPIRMHSDSASLGRPGETWVSSVQTRHGVTARTVQ